MLGCFLFLFLFGVGFVIFIDGWVRLLFLGRLEFLGWEDLQQVFYYLLVVVTDFEVEHADDYNGSVIFFLEIVLFPILQPIPVQLGRQKLPDTQIIAGISISTPKYIINKGQVPKINITFIPKFLDSLANRLQQRQLILILNNPIQITDVEPEGED